MVNCGTMAMPVIPSAATPVAAPPQSATQKAKRNRRDFESVVIIFLLCNCSSLKHKRAGSWSPSKAPEFVEHMVDTRTLHLTVVIMGKYGRSFEEDRSEEHTS